MTFEDLLEEITKSFKESTEKNIKLNTERDTNKMNIKRTRACIRPKELYW